MVAQISLTVLRQVALAAFHPEGGHFSYFCAGFGRNIGRSIFLP
jgi:hypothetical protein